MTRPSTALLALAVVVVALAIPFAAATPASVILPPDERPPLQTTANGSAGNGTAPGATLNGALGSEQAELDGEFERRSLGHAVGTATSVEARAAAVADRLAAVEDRLAALEARKERLAEARDNGTITDAEYRARMTVLAAEARSLDRLGSRTAVYANVLPPETLAERGVTSDRLADLRARATNLSAFESDIFDGAYGNRTLPSGGLDEPFEDVTLEDPWWNVTAPNGTTWNGTDGFDWNETTWNGTGWNRTDWNESEWNGSDWDESNYNEPNWNESG